MKQNLIKKYLQRHSQRRDAKNKAIDTIDAYTFLKQQSNKNQLEKEWLDNDQRRWTMML